jgi:hypothetical protein
MVVPLSSNERTSERSHFRSWIASLVQSPFLKFPFSEPRGALGGGGLFDEHGHSRRLTVPAAKELTRRGKARPCVVGGGVERYAICACALPREADQQMRDGQVTERE